MLNETEKPYKITKIPVINPQTDRKMGGTISLHLWNIYL